MNSKIQALAAATLASLIAHSADAAPAAEGVSEKAALTQCVSLRTTGADRVLTARWLFAVLSQSPQIADLSAVPPERIKQLNQGFAKLMTRLVTKDCADEVRPLAAGNLKGAFEQVGEALGETAMNELMSGDQLDKSLGAYTEYLSEDDFKALIDSLPSKSK